MPRSGGESSGDSAWAFWPRSMGRRTGWGITDATRCARLGEPYRDRGPVVIPCLLDHGLTVLPVQAAERRVRIKRRLLGALDVIKMALPYIQRAETAARPVERYHHGALPDPGERVHRRIDPQPDCVAWIRGA